MGFHLDTTGNVWLGSGSSGTTLAQAITAGPPNFYVTNTGSIFAQAGTIGGITVDSTGIYANYDAGNTGFKIFSSDGSAEFDDVTIRADIQNSDITGSVVMGSGGEIKTSSGTSRIEIGNTNETYISFIQGSATTGRIETIAGSGGADTFRISSFLNDDLELYAGGGSGKLEITAGEIYIPVGASLSFSGDDGSPGEVLTRNNAGGANWAATSGHSHTGYSFPNSGTLLSNDNHNHSNLLDGSHLLANNPHSVYVENANHSHSNFLENADLSDYVTNSNTNFLSAVGHVAMAAGNAGVAHGLTLGDVLTNSNHSHGNVHNHSGTVLTTSGADNLYSTPHNHPYGTGNGNGNGNGNSNLSNANVDTSHGPHGNGNHNHSGTVLTTAGSGNLYSAPHNSHSHNHSSYVTNTTYNNHLNNLHFSDSRLKTNIVNTSFGLSYINSLRPVDYEYTSDTLDAYFTDENTPFLRDMYTGVKHGFIAQEVRTSTFDNHASNTAFGGLGYKAESEQDNFEDIQTVDLEQFIGPVIKSIQELSAKIDLLTARVEELEGV
nr:putative outer membrane protein [uncultured Mediterranean phage uvMED]